MSVYPTGAPNPYYAIPPQATSFALPQQQPPMVATSEALVTNHVAAPAFSGMPVLPDLQAGNSKDLVADLCKIIERQSQEIAALRQERAEQMQAVAAKVEMGEDNAGIMGEDSSADSDDLPPPPLRLDDEGSETNS